MLLYIRQAIGHIQACAQVPISVKTISHMLALAQVPMSVNAIRHMLA